MYAEYSSEMAGSISGSTFYDIYSVKEITWMGKALLLQNVKQDQHAPFTSDIAFAVSHDNSFGLTTTI